MIAKVKVESQNKFEIKDLGGLCFFLGIEVIKEGDDTWMLHLIIVIILAILC